MTPQDKNLSVMYAWLKLSDKAALHCQPANTAQATLLPLFFFRFFPHSFLLFERLIHLSATLQSLIDILLDSLLPVEEVLMDT